MNEKKRRIYGILALIGWAIWMFAYPIRLANMELNSIATFFIGIAPNLGVAISFPFLCLSINTNLKKQISEMKILIFSTVFMFICLIISEIIHQIFMNSLFDIYDLIMSAVGVGLNIIIYTILSKSTFKKTVPK